MKIFDEEKRFTGKISLSLAIFPLDISLERAHFIFRARKQKTQQQGTKNTMRSIDNESMFNVIVSIQLNKESM